MAKNYFWFKFSASKNILCNIVLYMSEVLWEVSTKYRKKKEADSFKQKIYCMQI